MNKLLVHLFAPVILCQENAVSLRRYATTRTDFIFSYPYLLENNDHKPRVRISMFCHYHQSWPKDLTSNLGVYTGFTIRNIGFVMHREGRKSKWRSYAINIRNAKIRKSVKAQEN